MSDKYYWLKLKRDFFKRHDIKIIEAMPNGKDYILFYLKLLCESVDHDGSLRFSEQIPYNEEMLSVITNTNVDMVRSAIKIFTQLNMMEVLDDGTLYMNEVNKMIGSAVDNDNANRQRRFRERQKELALQERYGSVTKNNESKSIEIDIEKEIDNKKEISKEKSDTFETFWKAYPKKVGKEKCFNWFKSHKVDSDLLKKMLNKIEEYKNTKQWSNPQYIPHPYTWLNQGRWDDEIETNDNFTSQSKYEIPWEEATYTLEDEILFFKSVQKNNDFATLQKNLNELKNRDLERYQIVLKALRLNEKPLGV